VRRSVCCCATGQACLQLQLGLFFRTLVTVTTTTRRAAGQQQAAVGGTAATRLQYGAAFVLLLHPCSVHAAPLVMSFRIRRPGFMLLATVLTGKVVQPLVNLSGDGMQAYPQ
jgi:hypothetical protein